MNGITVFIKEPQSALSCLFRLVRTQREDCIYHQEEGPHQMLNFQKP